MVLDIHSGKTLRIVSTELCPSIPFPQRHPLLLQLGQCAHFCDSVFTDNVARKNLAIQK